MTTVYRSPALAAPEPAKPTAFEYFPLQRGHDSSTPAMVGLLAPLLVGGAVAAVGLPEVALPVMAVTAIVLHLRRRRAKKLPAATLQIEGRMLRVLGPEREERLAVHLDELLDLSLDTKTVEPVQESPGPIPELMYINSTVGPSFDMARIEVVTRDSGSIYLTEKHLAHSDSLEWRGKMRQFLRKHGWVPESERDRPG